ncbi:MAG: glycosyltransferase family 39 protein [Smithella sp.]|nr:glycosyltransferase family 39 protein [Smithella sp.]
MSISKKLIWIFPILLLATLWQLGSWGVTDTSEARYAEIAREMINSHNWLMPSLLGIYHFDKPPFVYWITALGMNLFGVNAFGARFFLTIAYLLQIFLVYKIVLELFQSRRKAFFSALIYTGVPIVLISIRTLTIDAYLNTLELTAVLFLIMYFRQRKPGMLYLYFIALGLCIFAKGPVGIIIPVLMIYPIRKILNVQGCKNGLHIGLGIALTLFIGGWWFVFLMIQSNDFYHFLIREQLIKRMTDAGAFKRARPFWYYFAFLSAALMPTIFLLPQAIRDSIRQKATGMNWLACWGLLIPLLFFSAISSKLLLYVLPLAPYAAITCGWFIDEAPEQTIKKYYRLTVGFYAILLLGFLLLFIGLIPVFAYKPSVSAWMILILALLFILFFKTKSPKSDLVALSLLFPLFIIPISADFMSKSELFINSTAPIARFLKENRLDENRKIIIWNFLLSSLSFELKKEIYSVKWRHYSLQRHTEFQENTNWKKNLIDVENAEEALYLKSLINSPSVLISKKDDIPIQYQYFLTSYQHTKSVGKWMIYY